MQGGYKCNIPELCIRNWRKNKRSLIVIVLTEEHFTVEFHLCEVHKKVLHTENSEVDQLSTYNIQDKLQHGFCINRDDTIKGSKNSEVPSNTR